MATIVYQSAVSEDRSMDQANKALELMERALGLLDESQEFFEAGAHLDIAIHRLRDRIAVGL